MKTQKINPRFVILSLFMIVVALMRVFNAEQITPWSNFTPVGAMALFGGTYFSKHWKALLFPLLTLFASDLVINLIIFNGQYGIFYDGWYWIYGIFVLITFIGKWLIKKVNVSNIIIATITVSILHWLLSDLTMWMFGGIDLRTMQPLSRDWAGLLQCYIQGFPFMKNFLMGTLVYSGVMFGTFEWIKARKPSLQIA